MILLDDISNSLKDLKEKSLLRKRVVINSRKKNLIKINGKWLINFSNNDYLGLSQDISIKKAIINGIKKYGNGGTSSNLVSGHTEVHQNIEGITKNNIGFESSILFSSGYLANLGLITTISDKDSFIYADKLNHASLNDACILSRAKFFRYPHNDMELLERLLKKNKTKKKKLIVTDGVFSMDGDLADIPKLVQLAQKYDAYLYIDDAHGYGVLGKNGQGILEYFENTGPMKKIPRDRIIYTITLSKAVGVSGALVNACKNIINLVVNKSRTYIYTTAEQPALIMGVERSFEIIKKNYSLRERLNKSINLFRKNINKKNLLTNSITPIQPLIIESAEKTIKISEKLNSYGFHVPAIRPPTVPNKSSRLRISITALHSQADIKKLTKVINKILDNEN
ncbi:8-amino-7-oxononanoate synthase [Methylophilaceae bacterium]|jgi:8-amino-7-oxononanoate synthase|nr:8-amino-7-oxononanoate synthase [Methylophilaceae bacterium]